MNTSKLSTPITICCAALIFAFFMPWAQLGPFGASGYNLGKLSAQANWFWLIPLSALLTIVAGLCGVDQRPYAIPAGLIPTIGFIYALLSFGSDMFQVLAIGVYVTLGSAISVIGTTLFAPIPDSLSYFEKLLSYFEKFKIAWSEGPPRDTACPRCGAPYNWFDRVGQPVCCTNCWTIEKEKLTRNTKA